LPKLPEGKKWYLVYDTDTNAVRTNKELKKQDAFTVNERSIQVLLAK